MSKYNHQPSSYCYPGSDVLKNKNNIRDPESLEKFERILTTWRISQLSERPIAGNFDLEHLELIHHYIFQDIYSFAGELRTESIAKDQFVFALPQYIQSQADQLFVQLKEEQQLRNLSAKKFAERAAHYMAEINVIHPFREGNGRAQREFIRSLAYANGYALQWERTDPQQLLQASIRSISNIDSLSRHIYTCLANKIASTTIAKHYEIHTQIHRK